MDFGILEPTFEVVYLFPPEGGHPMPEVDPFFGVFVLVVEVFGLRRARLAYDAHARLSPIESPVHKAPVGLLRQRRVYHVHQRRAHRTVALGGFEEQLVKFLEVVFCLMVHGSKVPQRAFS
jgi:hypothetical protein